MIGGNVGNGLFHIHSESPTSRIQRLCVGGFFSRGHFSSDQISEHNHIGSIEVDDTTADFNATNLARSEIYPFGNLNVSAKDTENMLNEAARITEGNVAVICLSRVFHYGVTIAHSSYKVNTKMSLFCRCIDLQSLMHIKVLN